MENLFIAKDINTHQQVIGELIRPKMYDNNRRFMWIKIYNEDRTAYIKEKIQVIPESIQNLIKNIFGKKVRPTKALFPNLLFQDKEYCVLGIKDNYVTLIEWENRGNYGEFLRVRFENFENDFIFLAADDNVMPHHELFGKKIMFKNEKSVLNNIELCVIGICESAIAVIEWTNRGNYHFDCYTLRDISDFEIIKDK